VKPTPYRNLIAHTRECFYAGGGIKRAKHEPTDAFRNTVILPGMSMCYIKQRLSLDQLVSLSINFNAMLIGGEKYF
jgi:hypothetical protein